MEDTLTLCGTEQSCSRTKNCGKNMKQVLLLGGAAIGAWLLYRQRRQLFGWLTSKPKRYWPDLGVEVRTSRIPDSGDGLFAAREFAVGDTLGEYRGRVLSLLQATRLEDRDYLMGGFGINAHVDARFAVDAPGRYVNDHFDKKMLNAAFEKDKARKRAVLVATRRIVRGEEIYASYGESYWRSRGIDPDSGRPLPAS